MVKKLLTAIVAMAVLSQGIARADEPAPPNVAGNEIVAAADEAANAQPPSEGETKRATRDETPTIQYLTTGTPRREKVGKIVEIAALVGIALAFLLNWASHMK